MIAAKGDNRGIWLWEDLPSWEETLWTLMGDVLSPKAVQRFKMQPPKYLVGDDLSWLDQIIREVTGSWVNSKSLLADRIVTIFDGIRAYHATRTSEVEPFYRLGLVPLDAAEFEDRARSIFLCEEFPELSRDILDKAIASVGRDLRHGSLFFDVHRDELIEGGAHYLLYGSEYLTAIAAHIDGPRDYRQVLKRFGVPTIFTCDVPFELMHPGAVRDFSGQALRILFERVLNPEYQHPQWGEGGGVVIKSGLLPNFIVGHSHPKSLRDPLLNYQLVLSPPAPGKIDDREPEG